MGLGRWEGVGSKGELGGERVLVGKGRLGEWGENRCKYFMMLTFLLRPLYIFHSSSYLITGEQLHPAITTTRNTHN